MTSLLAGRIRGASLIASLLVPMLVLPLSPAAAAPLQLGAADTVWMLLMTMLVLLMAVAGLALFYSGLVRAKNAIATLTQVFTVFCVAAVVWFACGYSVAFSSSSWVSFFGGFGKAFLISVKPGSIAATHTLGAGLPEYVHFAFQMMLAGLAPALIVGAFAERMRFQAVVLFAVLWSAFVYVPITHMMWFAPGPDAIADAARAIQLAAPGAARRQAEIALAALQADAGLFAQWGAIDFAGGLVVHASAGIAGLIGALVVGQRGGYGRETMAPHNLAMMLMGGALLWIGLIGLNAGAALGANNAAALAVINSLLAAVGGAVAWIAIEIGSEQQPSLIGVVSGMLAGLVAVAAGAGYVAPVAAFALGLVAAPVCYWACTYLKHTYQYDDSLDVFGIHCVGGVLGMLAVGVLASPDLGGAGIASFALRPGEAVIAPFDIAGQMRAQVTALAVALCWSSYVSYRLFKLVDSLVGLRPSPEDEARGLDIVDHGERVYN